MPTFQWTQMMVTTHTHKLVNMSVSNHGRKYVYLPIMSLTSVRGLMIHQVSPLLIII